MLVTLERRGNLSRHKRYDNREALAFVTDPSHAEIVVHYPLILPPLCRRHRHHHLRRGHLFIVIIIGLSSSSSVCRHHHRFFFIVIIVLLSSSSSFSGTPNRTRNREKVPIESNQTDYCPHVSFIFCLFFFVFVFLFLENLPNREKVAAKNKTIRNPSLH